MRRRVSFTSPPVIRIGPIDQKTEKRGRKEGVERGEEGRRRWKFQRRHWFYVIPAIRRLPFPVWATRARNSNTIRGTSVSRHGRRRRRRLPLPHFSDPPRLVTHADSLPLWRPVFLQTLLPHPFHPGPTATR